MYYSTFEISCTGTLNYFKIKIYLRKRETGKKEKGNYGSFSSIVSMDWR